jgi:hypothetical protein
MAKYEKVGQIDVFKKKSGAGWFVLIVIIIVIYMIANGKC